MNIFKKIHVSFYKALAYIFYYYGMLFQYLNVSKAEQAMNDMWLISLHYDLKSGSTIWLEYAIYNNEYKEWKSLKDKDELIYVVSRLYDKHQP
jgi:hypothetical protein